MRTAFDVVSPTPSFEQLPIQIEQVPPASLVSSRIMLLLPAVAAISVLLGGVAIAAAGEPGVLQVLAARPLASIQIAAGLVLWAALFVVPASRAIGSIGRKRTVGIVGNVVQIRDRTLFGVRTRSVPLASYEGVAHHIRASLSALTHEIILVHQDPSWTVTLASAERITQSRLDEVKALLNLPEVPARAIYERGALSRTSNAARLDPARA